MLQSRSEARGQGGGQGHTPGLVAPGLGEGDAHPQRESSDRASDGPMMLQASGRGRRILAALLGRDLLSPAEGWERVHCTRPLDDEALHPCGQVPGAVSHDKPLSPGTKGK